MEKAKIDRFIMINGKYFPTMMIKNVKTKLESLDENKESMLLVTKWKNPNTAFIFAFLLGNFGVDRFWLGQKGLGVVKLITFLGFYILYLIQSYQLLLAGGFNADCFDTRQVIVMYITLGCGQIWWLIDLFTVFGRAKKYNYNKLMTFF
jgi:hypothetical protein